MAEMGTFDQRVRWLEAAQRNDDSLIKDILRRLATAEQRALVPSGGGGGGGSGLTIGWAYCPTGIAAATVTGTAPVLTLTPSSNSGCYVVLGRASGAWVLPGGTSTVWNDWPSGPGVGGAGIAGTHFCQVYLDTADSTVRVLGEQCG